MLLEESKLIKDKEKLNLLTNSHIPIKSLVIYH